MLKNKLKIYSEDYLGCILYGLSKSLQAQSTLEIGCFSSFISVCLAKAAQENNSIHYVIDRDDKVLHGLNSLNLHDYVIRYSNINKFIEYKDDKVKFNLICIKSIDEIKDINLTSILDDKGCIIVNNYNNYYIKDYCDKMFNVDEWNGILIKNINLKHNQNNMIFMCQRR